MSIDLPGHEWFRPLLDSPVAAERAEGARAAGEAPAFDLEPRLRQLLDDDAPYARRHGDRAVIGEVRFDALVGLQALAAARRTALLLPDGAVVRKAMDAEEAKERSARALAEVAPARRAEVVRTATRDLVARVRPEDDRDAVLAYRTLQLLDQVDYRREEVDPARGTTALQEEVRASQLAALRPRPHLVVAEPGAADRPLGYVYREPGGSGRLVLDFAEGASAAKAEDEVRWALSIEPKGVPMVRHEDGTPVRTPNGALVFDGVLDLGSAPELDILRSLAALLAPTFTGDVVA